MTPTFCKSFGAFVFPYRGYVLCFSLLLIATIHALGILSVNGIVPALSLKLMLRFGGPVLAVSWAALCSAIWFPPKLAPLDTPFRRLIGRASVLGHSEAKQWQASFIVAVMLIVPPLLSVYVSFLF